jgi:predicted membrane protein
MNEDTFKNEIRERWGKYEKHRHHGRVWTGLLLLLIGILLFVKTANIILFPTWFFTWPVLLIAIGLFSGIRHGFRGGFWLILLIIGGLSLADVIDPSLNMDRFNWPIIFVVIGLVFILRPRSSHWRRWRHHRHRWQERYPDDLSAATEDSYDEANDRRDFVDITAVFGGVKKNVLTKSFKGGDIVSFMGGSEIDLSQADFNGKVRIDVTNIFGGTKLIVPSSWDVQSDVTAVFGGVDDKRQVNKVQVDSEKVLILDGTCMFGGIEIRSF